MTEPQIVLGSKLAPENTEEAPVTIAPQTGTALVLPSGEGPPKSTSPASPSENSNVTRTMDIGGVECDSAIWKSSENKWINGKVELDAILSKKHDERSDIEIYFLPRVEMLEGHSSMSEKISTKFYVPRFFWTHTGWNANGFFGSYENPLGDTYEKSFASYTRFLVKELLLSNTDKDNTIGDPRKKFDTKSHKDIKTTSTATPKDSDGTKNIRAKVTAASDTAEGYGYQWQYISFVTLWFLPKQLANGGIEASKGGSKQVVLCFDHTPTMKGMLKDSIEKCKISLCQACPFGIFEPLLSTLFTYYDWALWDFQKPVRDIEKARDDFTNIENYKRVDMYIRYIKMHELARHIIHLTETLGVGARTVRTMRDAHCERCSNEKSVGHYHHIQGDLKFFELFLQNLQARASAFDQRLGNEIKLAFNLFAADDNATAKEILEESQHDGRDLTNLVALLTLIFLPASFLTSFFGMHFFDPERSQPDLSHPKRLWLYFAVTGPVSAVAVAAWYGFRKWIARRRKVEKENRKGIRVGGPKQKLEDLSNLKRAESYLAPPGQGNHGVTTKDFVAGSKSTSRVKMTSYSPPNA